MQSNKRTEALAALNQTQKERLSFIDFRLMFLGMIQRADLIQRFGMKEAAATRDIALYKQLAEENLYYDTRVRAYFYADSFVPLFDYSAQRAITALTQGFGDDFVGIQTPSLLLCETPAQLGAPHLSVLSLLTRAIHQHQVVKIQYYSLSSGFSSRDIVPFAIVDNGLRWHVRAYDRKHARFADFVINRIKTPRVIDSLVHEHETRDADIQWNHIVELEIVPHPELEHPETIARDYDMSDGVLHINVRAVIAGYLLRRWNIDCSTDHSLDAKVYQLWLRNYQALYAVSSNIIAPGYTQQLE